MHGFAGSKISFCDGTALARPALLRLRLPERPKAAADKGGNSMKLRTLTAIALAAGVLAAGAAYGQQQAPSGPPDLNAIPDKMPFNLPFGTPIGYDGAQQVIQAAIAEA